MTTNARARLRLEMQTLEDDIGNLLDGGPVVFGRLHEYVGALISSTEEEIAKIVEELEEEDFETEES